MSKKYVLIGLLASLGSGIGYGARGDVVLVIPSPVHVTTQSLSTASSQTGLNEQLLSDVEKSPRHAQGCSDRLHMGLVAAREYGSTALRYGAKAVVVAGACAFIYSMAAFMAQLQHCGAPIGASHGMHPSAYNVTGC
jgi:hypothetical protein